jgi:hypothetical protein
LDQTIWKSSIWQKKIKKFGPNDMEIFNLTKKIKKFGPNDMEIFYLAKKSHHIQNFNQKSTQKPLYI